MNALKGEVRKAKILVIEDEEHIAEGIKLNLEFAGHEVELASNGIIGLEKWKSFNPGLLILDIMMPEMDGHEVLKKVRLEDESLPILILSAKNESIDKVKAFRGGVDDYLGKPFSLDEFLLRIERLLLRSQWGEKKKENSLSHEFQNHSREVVKFGENCVYLGELRAQNKKGGFSLTEQEVKLLRLFFENPDIPLERQKLLEVGWGYGEEVHTRTLDNFMVRFRKYFEPSPKRPIFFQSIRGVGYLWSPRGQRRQF